MPHRVSIPVTLDVAWVLTVPEVCLGETRPASAGALRELDEAFSADDAEHDDMDWFELLARYAFECGSPERAE